MVSFGPPLGHERDLVGPRLDRDRHDRRLDGHLQVKPGPDGLAEDMQVAVLDMAAIFAEMDRDPVRPRQLGQNRRPDRVRLIAAPGLAEGGDVVDVNAKTGHVSVSLIQELSNSQECVTPVAHDSI